MHRCAHADALTGSGDDGGELAEQEFARCRNPAGLLPFREQYGLLVSVLRGKCDE